MCGYLSSLCLSNWFAMNNCCWENTLGSASPYKQEKPAHESYCMANKQLQKRYHCIIVHIVGLNTTNSNIKMLFEQFFIS